MDRQTRIPDLQQKRKPCLFKHRNKRGNGPNIGFPHRQITYDLIVRNRKHPYRTAIYKLITDWLKKNLSKAVNGQ